MKGKDSEKVQRQGGCHVTTSIPKNEWGINAEIVCMQLNRGNEDPPLAMAGTGERGSAEESRIQFYVMKLGQ